MFTGVVGKFGNVVAVAVKDSNPKITVNVATEIAKLLIFIFILLSPYKPLILRVRLHTGYSFKNQKLRAQAGFRIKP